MQPTPTRADIRLKAMVVITQPTSGRILVNPVYETDGRLIGYRIPGGHVEFGEKAQETIVREIHEEMGTELADVQFLHVIENCFTYAGRSCHEVIFIYRATFADPAWLNKDEIQAQEDNGEDFILTWQDPHALPGQLPLFPTGLKGLL